MIRNVHHKECICDICGAKEIILESKIHPNGWFRITRENITQTESVIDACIDCSNVIDAGIRALIKEKRK